jgi:methyl-accepting chemotaxis protein
MGPGGIATIIAASSLAIIAAAIAYAIVRLGRLIDEASVSIKAITDEATPLLQEVTTTAELINGPLQSINKVTKSVEEVATKITSATGNFIDNNSMAMKIAGSLLTAAKIKKEAAPRKRRKKVAEEEPEF